MKIGVLGGGQLGRMLALAAYPLGIEVRVFDPAPDACAGGVAPHVAGAFEDTDALWRFADGLDAVTFEWENVPVQAAEQLAGELPFYPPPAALTSAQDRLWEKSLFRDLGIETAPFLAVETRQELRDAVGTIGLPAVLKTRRLGYDGRGQAVIRSEADEDTAWAGVGGVPLLLEGFIPFQRELSIISVRDREGDMRSYPLVENQHRDGILRMSLGPARDVEEELQMDAEVFAGRVMQRLDYTGVLAIELFQHEGRLLANEMATRVHNSGHWTIEGAVTSQFENHMRAVGGLPLGSTGLTGVSAMVNLIGTIPAREELLAIPGAHLHLYGKEPRPGRKLGHVTLVAPSRQELEGPLRAVRELVQG